MPPVPEPTDLFPDAPSPGPVRRIRSANARIRQLRGLVGAEGLPPASVRTLLEELSAALEACARGLEELGLDGAETGDLPPLFPPEAR